MKLADRKTQKLSILAGREGGLRESQEFIPGKREASYFNKKTFITSSQEKR